MLYTDLNHQGKRCDCKSLHWKFSDKATCDGKVQSICLSIIHLVWSRLWAYTHAPCMCINEYSYRELFNSIVADLLLEQWDPHSDPEERHVRSWRNCVQETQGSSGPYDAATHQSSYRYRIQSNTNLNFTSCKKQTTLVCHHERSSSEEIISARKKRNFTCRSFLMPNANSTHT